MTNLRAVAPANDDHSDPLNFRPPDTKPPAIIHPNLPDLMDSVRRLDSGDWDAKSRPLSLEKRKNQHFNSEIFWFLTYMEISGQKILLWQRRSSCWGCPDHFASWICCRFPPPLFLMFSVCFTCSWLLRHQKISLARIVIIFMKQILNERSVKFISYE